MAISPCVVLFQDFDRPIEVICILHGPDLYSHLDPFSTAKMSGLGLSNGRSRGDPGHLSYSHCGSYAWPDPRILASGHLYDSLRDPN